MPQRVTSLLAILFLSFLPTPGSTAEVEQWDIWEKAFPGPDSGNPFRDVDFTATFHQGDLKLSVPGFYDGGGTYRLRFMPPTIGDWTYHTQSNRKELQGLQGTFSVVRPSPGNHGPVRVHKTFHFAYSDGTRYLPVGTTCYAWIHQAEAMQEQTLTTLRSSPFNKLRMCIFPKWYAFNSTEPERYPFVGTPPNQWDGERFNPEFFRHLEKRIGQLRDRGIEADLILFHPYDKRHWGFDRMAPSVDDAYLRYTVARLAAYRNVWWSLANEFDFMREKTDADWLRLLALLAKSDPYHHLRSIHNGTRLFNQTHPLLTHASIQNGSAVSDFGRALLYRDVYEKPIVFDEVKYEGDFDQRWGNLSAEEMVHRFWQGAIAGTYVGHGETYRDPKDQVWWSKGGQLRGQSPQRIAFLRKVLEDGPAEGLEPMDKWQDERTAGKKGEYYLIYFGKERPTDWEVALPRAGMDRPVTLQVDLLDTWNCTSETIPGAFTLKPTGRYRLSAEPSHKISLPGKPYLALRLRRVSTGK